MRQGKRPRTSQLYLTFRRRALASGSGRLASGLALLAALALTGTTAIAEESALARRGEELSQQHCARCHVISPDNRMGGIASTPSFMILIKALDDWHDRFQTFHARRPHPAHVRFVGDAARAPDHPATITEVILVHDDIAAIVAYAEQLARQIK
ncbi:cytochrome c [Stappia indica]|uniref:cytochrome c n=1 Tax=Stappia indica TaxID=538381 RepID=UPI001CD5BDA8|nr:cytochrome c [Stappia indica]MCA1297262.1 cytochrome c [Stappia indica]